jgi:hypothetical protein
MRDLEEQLRRYGAAVERAADAPEVLDLVPLGGRRRSRWVAAVAAVAILATSIAGVVVRDGRTIEQVLPAGAGPADLQRFGELVVPQGEVDRAAPPAGPAELAAEVDLVVTGRIAGFGSGRVEVEPGGGPERGGGPDRTLVTMQVAVEDVVRGQLPAGSEGRIHVELGMFRMDATTPRTMAAVAPMDGEVVLYLFRATGGGPDGPLPRFRDPAAGAPSGQPLWWPAVGEGFHVEDGRGGVVSLGDGREFPDTALSDVLPPNATWPSVDPGPPLGCTAGDGIAGQFPAGGWPVLSAVDPPGTVAFPRAPSIGRAIDALATTQRGFPPADDVAALGERRHPTLAGYSVVFESLTARTVEYHDAELRTLAVFYVGGTDATGWRVRAFEACDSWYQALPPPPLPVTEGPRWQGDPEALDACHQLDEAYPGHEIVGSFTSDAGTVRAWRSDLMREPGGPEVLDGRPDDEVVFVCYLDGPFSTPGPPGHDVPDRGIVVVDTAGDSDLLQLNQRELLSIERPFDTTV